MTNKPDSWWSWGQLQVRYPELTKAIKHAYGQHPAPGSESLVRVPEIAKTVVSAVAETWSTQNGKPAAMFPFHGWVVIYAWVKYRKESDK